MSLSNKVLALLLAFSAGILFNSIIPFNLIFVLVISIIGVFLISVFFKYQYMFILGLMFISLTLGILHHYNSSMVPKEFSSFSGDVSFIGTIVREPEVQGYGMRIIVLPDFSNNGKVQLSTNRFSELDMGDVIQVSGTVTTFEESGYRNYMASKGVYFSMFYSKIELLKKGNKPFIFKIKDRFEDVLYYSIRSPESTLLGAMVLGNKHLLSNETKEKLNVAGVRHITAVSGMHVAVLSGILMSLFLYFGLWRKQAFVATIIVLFLFILLTGLQSSAIRAGIMGTMFLLGQVMHRQSVSVRGLVFAGSFMLFFNPKLLIGDVGFQLSFLAVLGIIMFLPLFQKWLKVVPNIMGARDILGMTFAAQILTLPLLIYSFEYISVISPLINILLIPFIPLLISIGFIFLLFGAIFQPIGLILSIPVSLLLYYFILVIDIASWFPINAITINISLLWLIPFYFVVMIVWWLFYRSNRFDRMNT